MRGIRFGAQLWSQSGDWPGLLDAAIAAEAAGWDSVWTWDHLVAIVGPWEQPVLEGWLAMAAIAARTERIGVGLMVGANTFRTPGQTAKLAVTLDHISRGRATLGIGAAYVEREHAAYGIDFGSSVGERIDRMDEAVGIVRRLLDGERFSHAGPAYRLEDAAVFPLPLQRRMPILVGGLGPRKTLRVVARHADAWNASGALELMVERDAALREHCAAIGRDPDEIERTTSFPIVLRDDPAEAERAYAAICGQNGVEAIVGASPIIGTPAMAAEQLRPYVDAGFTSIVARLPAPYDAETIARIGEVRALLVAAGAGRTER
jgi:alkanesulfonate monooxygenase SsuD/methylene tetrahydromethanopterin reductase-like flavin-dependent oxidoreductase (luciferase family)